jgi:hypothetical protein
MADDFWSTLGAQPTTTAPARTGSAAPSGQGDDAFWSTLGSGQTTTDREKAAPSLLSTVGSSLLRGVHEGLDVPAEALAGAADWIASKFGYTTNQQEQTKAGDVAFNQAYDVDPANQGIVPGAARVAGNILTTLPAAIGVGGVAGSAARIGARLLTTGGEGAAPLVGTALRYLPGAAGGAAGGATTSAQTGSDIGEGAVLGGALGAALPAAKDVGNVLLASKNPAVVQAVTEHGIPLRAGQVSQNKLINYLDNITAPESSNVAQRVAVTTDAARSMGVTPEIATANGLPAGQVTPRVMAFAQKLNGGVMNEVEQATTIPQTPEIMGRLRDIAIDASKTPSAFNDIKAHLQDILDSFEKNGGKLPGKIYGDLVAHGTPLDVATRADNSVVRDYAGRIKEVLQDAMQAAATPENAARYAQARLQYKNMMTIAPLVNKGIPGQISPLLLQGAANRSFKNNAFRGAGDLGDLGDVAQQFLKAPPQSGTEPRQLVRDTLWGDVKGLAKMFGAVTGGRVAQTVLGANPLTPFGAITPRTGSRIVPAAVATRNALERQPDDRR